MSMASRMIPAEFEYLQHLALDGRDLYAKGIKAAHQQAGALAVAGATFSLAQIVTAINGANGGAGIPNVTASASGADLVLTTNATGVTEAITVKSTGTANAALGFSTAADTTGTGTAGPTAGVVTSSAIAVPATLFGLTLNYTSTHSSTPTSGTITFGGAGGVLTVNGQVVDAMGKPVSGVQDVIVETTSTTAANITALGSPVGTIKVGSGTTKVWMQTSASGAFGFTVTDATEGQLCLLGVSVPDGVKTHQELQF